MEPLCRKSNINRRDVIEPLGMGFQDTNNLFLPYDYVNVVSNNQVYTNTYELSSCLELNSCPLNQGFREKIIIL
jgi:hypothetical protein